MQETPVRFLSGRSAGERIGYPLHYSWASLVAQLVKNLPAMWGAWFWSLGCEDTLEKGKATHSSILAWRIPWNKSMELQGVGHNWTNFRFHCSTPVNMYCVMPHSKNSLTPAASPIIQFHSETTNNLWVHQPMGWPHRSRISPQRLPNFFRCQLQTRFPQNLHFCLVKCKFRDSCGHSPTGLLLL